MDVYQTKSKFQAFFPVARLIHNLYSKQWSMLTKIRWPHQGAMHAKEEKNYFGLPFSINHTHSIVLLLVTLGYCKPTRLIWIISIWIEQNCRVTFFFTFRLGVFQKCHKQPSEFRMCVWVCWFYGHNQSYWTLKTSSKKNLSNPAKERKTSFWCLQAMDKQYNTKNFECFICRRITPKWTDEIETNRTEQERLVLLLVIFRMGNTIFSNAKTERALYKSFTCFEHCLISIHIARLLVGVFVYMLDLW